MTTWRPRPGLKHTFKEPLMSALRDIWDMMVHVAIGPRWRMYVDSTNRGLYIQIFDPATRQYRSRMLLDKDGNLTTEGTHTASTSITDVGRGGK